MKTACVSLLAAIAILSPAWGQPYETNVFTETVAGSAFSGHVDGSGIWTMFNWPTRIATDQNTNFYVWDSKNRAIRKTDSALNVTTFASSFAEPWEVLGLFCCGSNLLVAGRNTHSTIWMLTPSGPPVALLSSNNLAASGVVCDSKGAVYFSVDGESGADVGQKRIYKITNGTAIVFAGSGNNTSIDGVGIFSSFRRPQGMAIDSNDNLYVMDSATIRRISPAGVVTTLPVTLDYGATLSQIACDKFNNLYVFDQRGRILKITGNQVKVLAGSGEIGFRDGDGPQSMFSFANDGGVAFGPDGRLYVADTANNRIRRVVFDAVPVGQLAIDMRPSLSIVGEIGRTYRIESRNSLTSAWNTVSTVLLTNNPLLWVDERFGNRQQHYRAVRMP